MSYDIDKGFFSKLLETGDLLTVKENQITEKYFKGDAKNAFKYITKLAVEVGEVPSVRAFKRRFPSFKLEVDEDGKITTEEDLLFWCKEVQKRARHNTIALAVQEVAENLEDFETEEAYKKLKSTIAYIEGNFSETSAVDITKNPEDRIQAYLKRKTNQGITGIPTGFNKLDFIMKGFGESTLTTLIARTGEGKSWFEIIIGANCMLNNYRVLQLVTEMPEDVMRDRYEAVLFKRCYGNFNYNLFKSGRLSNETEKKYFQFLRKDLPKLEPLIIDTATGVMGVSALIERYKPDIVLIDSAYLMEDDQNAKDDWLRITHITRDLKKLAKRTKVPIFINTQADKNTSRKTGPELGSIMYSQSVGQDSDNVLALYRDEMMINDKEMGVKVLKQREGELGKLLLQWDFDTMTFSEIYAEQGSVEEAEEEVENTVDLE